MATMALSKSSLSGCFEFTPASGLTLKSSFFFFLGCFSLAWAATPPNTSTANATAAIFIDNRFITPHCGDGLNGPSPNHFQVLRRSIMQAVTGLRTHLRPCEPHPADYARPLLDLPRQRRRFRPPEAPLLLGRPEPPY